MRYFYGAAHEQFPPEDLLKQAVEAERAGFDGVGCSDHLQPWWEPGESGHAWVWLGAAGQTTERVALGTAVTPPGPRFHPSSSPRRGRRWSGCSRDVRSSGSVRASH